VVCAVVLTGVFLAAAKIRRFERDVGVDERESGGSVTEDERRARQLGIALTSGGAYGTSTH